MGHSKTTLHFLMKFWPIAKFLNWLIRRPPFSRWLRTWLGPEKNHAVIIPVQRVIQGTKSLALPKELLRPMIEQASDCIVLNECLCRKAENCQNYPVEIGCLFLGHGAAQIHPTMGRKVSRTEALDHVERAVQAGLVPMIIHAAFDAYILGIPYNQMLAVCFCCDCCCTVRSGLRIGPQAFWDAVERLPGLIVRVSDACVGCGMCLGACPMQAITLVEGKAVIGTSCKGCGRCGQVCPVGGIEMESTDVGSIASSLADNLKQRTEIR